MCSSDLKAKTRTAARLEAELAQLEVQVAELLERARQADQHAGEHDQLPQELTDVQARRTRLLQAKTQLEQQARQRHQQRETQRQERPPGDRRPPPVPPQPRPTDTINPTDPDSTLTRARTHCLQGYNAQLAVSARGSGLIVATDVVTDGNDLQQLEPMSRQIVGNVGPIEQLLVDTGYENTRHIQQVEAQHGCQIFCRPAAIANTKDPLQADRKSVV